MDTGRVVDCALHPSCCSAASGFPCLTSAISPNIVVQRKGSRRALGGQELWLSVWVLCAGQGGTGGTALARLVVWCLAVYPLPTAHAQTNTRRSAAKRRGCRCFVLIQPQIIIPW